MGSGAIINVPRSGYAKNSAKKKGNGLGKSKQNKREAQRQQWLSQVKNKGETNGPCKTPPSITPTHIVGKKTQGTPPSTAKRVEHQDLSPAFHNEPISWMSTSLSWRKSHCNSFDKDHSGKRNCCSGSCSSSNNEEDGREDSCLDDWEAMADALTSDQVNHTQHESYETHQSSKSLNNIHDHGCRRNSRAWTPYDVLRPQNLPSLLKPHNLMQSSETGLLWQRGVVSEQSLSCPICCEDFDETDSSFLPCPCGFQLCLFCHRRILEVDGRCPGCRKQYDLTNSGGLPLALEMTGSCYTDKNNKRF